MVDDHRLRAPLGLRPLAGIVDDERIEVRQRRQDRLGKAFGRQCQRLPRQPFESAVLAEMDDRVGAKILSNPGISREIAVRRHQRGIVIGRFRIDVVAARRLDQHRDIAGAKAGNRQAAAIKPARAEERIALGWAPARGDRLLHAGRQSREERRVVGEGQRLLGRRAGICVGRAGEQPSDQRLAVFRGVGDPVAGPRQRPQDRDRRGRRVEADTVADAAVAVWVVGEDQRDAALPSRLRPQPRPVARQIGDKGDAVGDRPVADEIGLGLGVAAERRLERNRARENAPVDLGERHIHREVARAEPASSGAPAFFVAAGEDDLQNRAVGCRERVGRRHPPGRKTRSR